MNKKLSKLNIIFASLIMIVSLFILFNVLIAKFQGTQPRIFNYSFHIVVTDSMTPELNVGDFIIAEKTDKENIIIGDFIIFISPDPDLKGKLIVHKVINTGTGENGEIYFNTQGIKEGVAPDSYPVANIIGKYCGKSALFGKIIIFLSSIQNILFFAVFITIIVIIVKQIKNILKIKKENTENLNENNRIKK